MAEDKQTVDPALFDVDKELELISEWKKAFRNKASEYFEGHHLIDAKRYVDTYAKLTELQLKILELK